MIKMFSYQIGLITVDHSLILDDAWAEEANPSKYFDLDNVEFVMLECNRILGLYIYRMITWSGRWYSIY